MTSAIRVHGFAPSAPNAVQPSLVLSTALAEQFPVHMRSTGLALAYNFAVMLFGGFAQLIVTWLIRETGTPLAPAFYVMFGAVAGSVGVLFMTDRYKDEVLH